MRAFCIKEKEGGLTLTQTEMEEAAAAVFNQTDDSANSNVVAIFRNRDRFTQPNR